MKKTHKIVVRRNQLIKELKRSGAWKRFRFRCYTEINTATFEYTYNGYLYAFELNENGEVYSTVTLVREGYKNPFVYDTAA